MAVEWRASELMLRVKLATAAMLTKAAFEVEAQAKVNIGNNQQIDTGFMVNTVYTVAPHAASQPAGSGEYYSRVEERTVQKTAAPARQPAEGAALVGVAAEYALPQELRQSFLYRALEQVAAGKGGDIVAAGRSEIGD